MESHQSMRPAAATDHQVIDAAAHRVADLEAQIDFLDNEATRYRGLLESERIRHSTELAELRLKADTELDSLRRTETGRIQEVHDAYRSMLTERQVEFEQSLSVAAAASAEDLESERSRQLEQLEQERARLDASHEAARRQVVDELGETHDREKQALISELQQTRDALDRTQQDLDFQITRTAEANDLAHGAVAEQSALQRQLDRLQRERQLADEETRAKLDDANRRLNEERQRSAAALAELLERSASIARETDSARDRFTAQLSAALQDAAAAQLKSQAEYQALATAADERATAALRREAELEALIAELRR